jgi:TPR repeat protein
MPYNFLFTGQRIGGARDSMADFEAELGFRSDLKNLAEDGAPNAQLVYGLLLDGPFKEQGASNSSEHAGLPWLVKAAQAGEAVAQYQVAQDLLLGRGCRRDEIKGLKWMRIAAEQNEPDADVALAMRRLRGTPSATDVTAAEGWLERAVAQREEDDFPNSSDDARLLLAAILAATPQDSLRNPARALELLKGVHDVDEDPTPFDIRAAAQAAEGDFSDAVSSEQAAISRARELGWDLSPLEQRLSLYQSHKPWYGSLLEF